MKKTLAAATVAALVGVAGAANAADLYSGGGMKDVPAFVPPPTWTGFYIGAHVGGFWSDIKNHDDGFFNWCCGTGWGTPFSWNNNESGVFGGGQIGYNWQTNGFVLGVEVDLGAMGLNHKHTLWSDGWGDSFWSKDEATFYADVTGRLGYAWGPALFYAKGGWAFLDAKNSIGFTDGLYGGLFSWSRDHSGLDGWVVGGGVEYAFSPNWSVKAEYLFFDFGTNHLNWTDTFWVESPKVFNFDHELQVNTFKVGLNYRLNTAYAPLK